MNSRVLQLFAVTILLCMALAGHAAIYRCVDQAGNVLFTQHHCAPGQQGEVVNLGQNESASEKKPRVKVCKEVEKLADVLFPHVNQQASILDVYSDLGGRASLSAGITAVVNYVYAFRYNPKAKKNDVVALTRNKCLDGGFGNITEKDLPDWSKIKYLGKKPEKKTEPKPTLTKEQLAERHVACQDISEKLARARKRLGVAKSKGQKMQARLDVEYYTHQAQEKCDGIKKAAKP